MPNLIPSTYFLVARLIPAVLSSVPFFVFYSFFLHPWLGDLSQTFLNAKWPGDITGSLALIYLLVLTGRAIGKNVFERKRFSKDETRMPTTDFLMHSNDEYTSAFRLKIHTRIATDFGITILDAEAEAGNEKEARKTIAEAIALIRQRVKDGRLVLQHNMEYGFWRNLIGGATLAVSMSLVNTFLFRWVSPDHTAFVSSIVLFFLYLIPIVLCKKIMEDHGRHYARKLIEEYLGS